MQPVRIQRSRRQKQVSPNGLPIVYVGRPGKYGNPFRIVEYSDGKWAVKTDGSHRCNEILINTCHAVYDTKSAAAVDAIKCYVNYILPYKHGGTMDSFFESQLSLESIAGDLKGKNLSCWCKADEPCHADVLLKLANN